MNDIRHRTLRFPAEWEPCQAVMISWPHDRTDWSYMLPEVEACYKELATAITRYAHLVVITPHVDSVEQRLLQHGIDRERMSVVEALTNDTWIRDYGFITTLCTEEEDGKDTLSHYVLNDFCFNGWGLKFAANLDNLVNLKLHFSGLLDGVYNNQLGFVLEGGSIESDGKGTLLTTSGCLLSPNRNGGMDRRQISTHLKKVLGVEKVRWVNHGWLEGDDTDGHIDTLARFAPNNTILYTGCQNPADLHYEGLTAMRHDLSAMKNAKGEPFHLIELPLPAPIYDSEGLRLPATYANFLVVNNAVLYPTYGQEKNDRLAGQILQIAFPEHEIVGVDCRALIRQHGSLHCATMQLYKLK